MISWYRYSELSDGGIEDAPRFAYRDDVEPILNSLQQLKAEISALLTEYYHYQYEVSRPELAEITWNKLRKLSAI